VASKDRRLFVSRTSIRQQITRSFYTATKGVIEQSTGTTKLATESRLRDALQGPGAKQAGVVSDLRARSRIGVNHKEQVAVMSVDMRGSTALAKEHKADEMFVVIQCFIPLMAFVAKALDGEVIGLRGDGLIAAFGFAEEKWGPCINRAYEAGMIMIEAHGEELAPFLAHKNYPTAKGVGVGVDNGRVTVTKIGLGEAIEVTAYGAAVNSAAKHSKLVNKLWLSASANGHLHGKDKDETFAPRTKRLRDA
jgi:class 3 adenylate cyclase